MQSNTSNNQHRPLPSAVSAWSKTPWHFLSLLLITHIFIDMSASITTPLLKSLSVHHQASDRIMGVLAAFLLASISFSQPLFGYIYDRFRTYWLMPLSILIVGSCIACVGLVDSFALLAALVIIGGLAVGAFHPMATAMAGSLTEKRRPLMIGIFVCAGGLGVATGPWFVSRLVAAHGLGATVWLFAPTIPVVAIAVWAFLTYHKLPHSKPPASHRPRSRQGGFFSRTILLLFAVASSRNFSTVICGVGMSFLMAEKFPDASLYQRSTGNALCLLGLAGGFGGLLSGLFIHPKSEKPGIIISLVIAAPLLMLFPTLSGAPLLVVLVLGTVAVASTVPLLTATGQRLLPHSSALASSIFMGLSWGVSGVLASIAVTWLGSSIGYTRAMPILIGAGLLLSLACTLTLPRIIRPSDDSHLVPAEPNV